MTKRKYPFGEDSEELFPALSSTKQNLLFPPQLQKLFNPLEGRNPPLISQKNLETLAQKFNNFYADDPRNDIEHFQAYATTPEKQREDFLRANPKPLLQKRSPVGKQLGRITMEALANSSSFRGIDLVPGYTTKASNQPVRGIFDRTTNRIILNPNKTKQDILSTIVHEGNHALESYNPYVKGTVENFLRKKLQDNGPLNEGYIPELYKGIQNIINLPEEFSKLYNADQPQQKMRIDSSTLANPFHGLAHYFDEIPTFALESLMRDNHPWIYNEQTNPDSRKLLRRLIKDTHQLYSNQGLVDKNAQLPKITWPEFSIQPKYFPKSLPADLIEPISMPETSFLEPDHTIYKHNRVSIPKYPSPVETTGQSTVIRPKYNELNQAFIDKIEFLRKRQPSQTNPITSQMESYNPNSLAQQIAPNIPSQENETKGNEFRSGGHVMKFKPRNGLSRYPRKSLANFIKTGRV